MSTLGDAHQGEACALTFYTGLYRRIGELERQIQVPYNVVASLLEYAKSEITLCYSLESSRWGGHQDIPWGRLTGGVVPSGVEFL